MKKQQLLDLINKYLEGGCSPDEEFLLEKYLEFLNNEDAGWNEKESGDKKFVEEKIYSEIMQMINKREKSVKHKIITSPYLLKIAASIIFLMVVSVSVLYITGVFNNNSDSVIWQEQRTIPGEKLLVKLADGSEIILNADSKLRYPANFQGKTREVYLVGEAYFEIKHDISKPFIVHTSNLFTTVLGTKFNISAFPDEKNISVSLIEGRVKVTELKSNSVVKNSILHPDEKLVYNVGNSTSKIEQSNIEDAIGWEKNVLKFKDEPLHNVFIQLERAYGVRFEIASKSFENYLITTNFQNASIWEISEIIKKLTGLDYKTVKESDKIKKIIFFKKGRI